MVFWKKNLFRLPSNSASKQFVDELTKLIGCWVSDCPLSTTALKSWMLLRYLLQQKCLNKVSDTNQQRAFVKKTRSQERAESKRTFERMMLLFCNMCCNIISIFDSF